MKQTIKIKFSNCPYKKENLEITSYEEERLFDDFVGRLRIHRKLKRLEDVEKKFNAIVAGHKVIYDSASGKK